MLPPLDFVFTVICFVVAARVANRPTRVWLLRMIGGLSARIGRNITLLLGIITCILIDTVILNYIGLLPYRLDFSNGWAALYLIFEPALLGTIIYSSVALGMSIGRQAKAEGSDLLLYRVMGTTVILFGVLFLTYLMPWTYLNVFAHVADSTFGFFMIMLLMDISYCIIAAGLGMLALGVPSFLRRNR